MKRTKWYLLPVAAVNLALLPFTVSEASADRESRNCYFYGPPGLLCTCREASPDECDKSEDCLEKYPRICHTMVE